MSPNQTADGKVIHDVGIIGAGPCGLAVAARLREHSPSALYTDVEHQRFHWINRHNGRMKVKSERSSAKVGGSAAQEKHSQPQTPSLQQQPRRPHQASEPAPMSVVVYDGLSDQWMTGWRRAFRALDIGYLRSPLFFHPDPRDRDGLLAFAYEENRASELSEIRGVVGKEISKHLKKKRNPSEHSGSGALQIDERDRNDYFTCSSALFEDYCQSIVRRYKLEEMVKRADVQSIQYDFLGDDLVSDKIFTLSGSSGVTYARTVVVAVGPGSKPTLPVEPSTPESGATCHSSQLSTIEFPPTHLRAKIARHRETNVLIVGGGLTSAQIADLAIRRGVSKVWHIMRGEMKVKHFDVDLKWVAKFKNVEKSVFWMADDDKARFEMIRQARNGGSMTPQFSKILRAHCKRSCLSIHTNTSIDAKSFDPASKTWNVLLNPGTLRLPPIDYIVYCTGAASDVSKLGMLETLRDQYPIKTEGGLPCLTQDLAWSEDVPCFFTGRLAGLRLGPGAGNLEGAREGAERVSWGVQEALRLLKKPNLDDYKEEENVDCCREGHRDLSIYGNRFDLLEAA
ncbi:MAG: hypothetical protein M1837_005142 [Sclerophora amabilis]|nr:MAG: hypothetical protein M1837_005142 [Sclerophora amabilis]